MAHPGGCGRARARALVSILLALLGGPRAEAQAGGSSGDGTVVLRLTGPDDPALRDSIRELLARLHLQIAPASVDVDGGSSFPAVARVEIDLSSRTDALLLVTDESGDVRFRRALPRDATPAIVREEIAHAVQSAVESALLAARERASRPVGAAPPAAPPASAPPTSSPPQAPPPAPPLALPPASPAPASTREQPAPSSRRSPFGLELTTLGGVGPIANGASPAARVGLGVAMISNAPLHPSVGLSVLYAVPFDTSAVSGVELSTHMSIVSARLLPAVELVHGKWLAVDLGAGGGVDVTTVAPRSDPAAYYVASSSLGSQTTRVDPILAAMLTAHVGLAAGVVFLLSAGADVDLESRQYVFEQGSAQTAVLSPWRVRPMALAGFGFTALGDGHFATAAR